MTFDNADRLLHPDDYVKPENLQVDSVIVFGTGHRPEDAGISSNEMSYLIVEAIRNYPKKIIVAICGMAAGFDLAWGMEALNEGIDIWTVRPWAGHRPRNGDQAEYSWLLKNATRNIVTNDSTTYPGPWVYGVRNRWMVEHGDEGITLWNGKESGGTYSCLQDAKLLGKKVTNIYPS